MIARFDAKAETALRSAFTSVARLEEDPVVPALAGLDHRERTEAIGLAIMITGYVMVDACGSQWPTQSSVQRIAEALATKGATAERLQLDAGQVYEYLSKVVLGGKRVDDVFPDEQSLTQLAVIVAKQALVIYRPKELEIWDYLDQVESAIETAWALDTTVLPAAVLRSYMPPSKSGDQGGTA
jgi:hypothetical protein